MVTILSFEIVWNFLSYALYFYILEKYLNKILTTREIIYRVEKKVSDRSFRLFYMLSAKKVSSLSFWLYTLIFTYNGVVIVISLILNIFLGQLYTKALLVLEIASAFAILVNVFLYFSLRWELIDRIIVNPKLIDCEISTLKNYRYRGLTFSGGNLFAKSIDLISTVAGQELTKRSVKRKVVKHLYRIFTFFSDAINFANNADDLEVKSFVSMNQDLPLSLNEIIARFDAILNNCEIETKVLRICQYTANRKRLATSA